MGWNFKKKQDPAEGERHEIKVLKNFRVFCEGQKVKWAKWAGQKASGISKPVLTALLCLFVLSASFYSVYLAMNGFITRAEDIEIAHINKPKHFDKTGDPVQSASQETLITEQEYQKIRKFNRQMDSLSKTANGILQYEQFVKAHPGLLDSLKRLESLYQQLNR